MRWPKGPPQLGPKPSLFLWLGRVVLFCFLLEAKQEKSIFPQTRTCLLILWCLPLFLPTFFHSPFSFSLSIYIYRERESSLSLSLCLCLCLSLSLSLGFFFQLCSSCLYDFLPCFIVLFIYPVPSFFVVYLALFLCFYFLRSTSSNYSISKVWYSIFIFFVGFLVLICHPNPNLLSLIVVLILSCAFWTFKFWFCKRQLQKFSLGKNGGYNIAFFLYSLCFWKCEKVIVKHCKIGMLAHFKSQKYKKQCWGVIVWAK